jgi:hypothetical protein
VRIWHNHGQLNVWQIVGVTHEVALEGQRNLPHRVQGLDSVLAVTGFGDDVLNIANGLLYLAPGSTPVHHAASVEALYGAGAAQLTIVPGVELLDLFIMRQFDQTLFVLVLRLGVQLRSASLFQFLIYRLQIRITAPMPMSVKLGLGWFTNFNA